MHAEEEDKRERERERERERKRGVGLTFFKGIINSQSALVTYCGAGFRDRFWFVLF